MAKKPHNSNSVITDLHPGIFCKVFSYLPLSQLMLVSRVSRRFKVLSQQEQIFYTKLQILGLKQLLQNYKDRKLPIRESLLYHLYQLPGGQYLPGNDILLGTELKKLNITETKPVPTTEIPSPLTPTSTNSPEISTQKISASLLPEINRIIIGAGGLKAALAKMKIPDIAKVVKVEQPQYLTTNSKSCRELLKQIYNELNPYYQDFKTKQTDSKVFRDFKDPSEIAAVLKRLKLFDQALFFIEDMEEISFAIQTSTEWFESTLLGQFEIAYDCNNILEMKKNAYASYQLNGGLSLVNLFISKNPVFFDQKFNPSLLSSKLPQITGPAMGYALADEFAKFMDCIDY
jgi:recyclin-1